MFFMGFSRNLCLLISFFVYLLYFTPLVCSLNTIMPSVLIHEPETMSSNNSMFTLGFFSPKNSTNRYVGIWFMTESNVVWVANRDKPLKDSFGILAISENGNLVVLDGQNQVVWSTNVSHITSNYSAQLLDSGNLILVERTRGVSVWQSFQHPCNSLIQDMKIRTNKKTGEKTVLTSWTSPSDPSYGQFSCSLETRNVTEVFVWKLNRPYLRSGPWDGIDFLGIPRISSSNSRDGFKMEGEEGILDLSFHADKTLWTFTLNSQGKVEQRSWNSQRNIWELKRIIGSSECDVYGKCGSFGICNSQNSPICSCLRGFEPRNREEWGKQNWTSGCVRREALKCGRDKNNSQAGPMDGFWILQAVKLPDDAQVLPSYFDDTVDCQTSCMKNCSCIAYAHERNLGCMIWISDLLDMQSFPDGGVDVYVRLAISELGTGRRKMTTPIIISVLMGTILIIVSGYFLSKKCSKQKGEMGMQTQDDKRRIMCLNQVHIPQLSLFGLKELATATNNFDVTNKLGQGGFGPVYKGKLQDGQEIAVKKLSRSSGQGMEEFINEVELISKLQHRNLVRLFGCCIEGEEILVYEYMPNKSLDAYIFDPEHQNLFDWGRRFNIIEGIVRGLLYLHRDSRLRIIHRDLKASNILLDKEMNPKISDFGMAKLFGGNEDQANTKRIVGTYGYISPEYATRGLYSEKSDVFSFGVLLLEIISGRKNTSFYEDAESLTLLGFAWKLWIDGNVIPLIDPQIYDSRFHKDVLRSVHIGLLCVQELAKDRPTMASVMSMLQSEIMDIPPPSQPAFVLRQVMSCAAEQTLDNNELCSINIVTISNCKGR